VTPPDTILAPDSGIVTIRGLALAVPATTDSGAPLHHHGVTTWRRLDRAMLAQHRPGSLAVYLLVSTDSGAKDELPPVPAPVLNDGPHLSYAIQWFGMALAVLTFGVVVLWRDGRALARPEQAP
jgi:cytochrome oxidase assembly protein ShyY1